MAETYTTRLRAVQQEYNSNTDVWGTELNLGALQMVDEGWRTIAKTINSDYTLTVANKIADEARGFVLIFTGNGNATVTAPAVDKPYIIVNNCTADVQVKPAGGTAATVRAGTAAIYYTNAAGSAGYVVDPTLDKIKTAAANVPMGGNKFTGLGTASGSGEATTFANRLDQFAAPTSDVSINNRKLTNLADPTDAQDAATRAYVISQTATSVAAAAASATAAAASASAASTSASNASTSATNSANSATASAGSATTASGFADEAQLWANEAEDVPVEPGLFSAFHWAQKAQETAATVEPLPSQTGNAGKFLSTDGNNTLWSVVSFATTRVFEKKTGNFSAAAFYRYRCETGAGAITVTLPASPADGDIITIRRKGANNVVVGRNGKTIAADASDLTIDADKREIDLKYNATTSDWEVEARAYA